MENKYQNIDLFNPNEMAIDWIESITYITIGDIKNAYKTITREKLVTGFFFLE